MIGQRAKANPNFPLIFAKKTGVKGQNPPKIGQNGLIFP
jgi:hypothetical protein